MAWATHDLGIWTAGTFDYLRPSADLAAAYADEFGVADLDRLRALVTEHHRLRPVDDDLVTETFRRADLVDVRRCETTLYGGMASVSVYHRVSPG